MLEYDIEKGINGVGLESSGPDGIRAASRNVSASTPPLYTMSTGKAFQVPGIMYKVRYEGTPNRLLYVMMYDICCTRYILCCHFEWKDAPECSRNMNKSNCATHGGETD